MRESYPVSDETRMVLTDRVKPVASEMDVDTSYLYQILSSATCDPFGKFRRLYAACVRSGADVTPWDAALSSIKARMVTESPQISETHCLSELIGRSADAAQTILIALPDGIDPHEAPEIRRSVAKLKDILDIIEAKLETPERRERAATVTRAKFGGNGK